MRWTAVEGLVALRHDALVPLLEGLAQRLPAPWPYQGAQHVPRGLDREKLLPPVVQPVVAALDRDEADPSVPPAAKAALRQLVSTRVAALASR